MTRPRVPTAPLSAEVLTTLAALERYGGEVRPAPPARAIDHEAETPEPCVLIPPDLTHALSELVMLYGPDLVKLAALRY